MTATALIVDDEVDLCRLMQMTLTKMGIKCDVAYDISTARQYLTQSKYDFCLTDMRLPDGSGLDLVKYITKTHCNLPVAVITAHGNMDIAIEALKLGAFDFVNKPLELPRLRQLIEHALRVMQEGEATNEALNDANKAGTDSLAELQLPKKTNADLILDKHLIGNSPAIAQLKSTIIKLARSQAPVFLWGESGTGKEVVAKLIHQLSPRREGEFVAVNCGAIPSELMESEFFGHKKGSFTGAVTDKQGLFQQADGGTLFLDEVADLPLSMQVKLLRAIQEKSVRAIGATTEVPVDIRILSATHKDLNKLVQQGQFRQDLFYRINVIELKLPKLNERGSDIELLANHFLQQIAEEWQLDETPTLSQDAQEALRYHDYEGNVRELRNLLERAITLADSNTLTSEHLGLSETALKYGHNLPANNLRVNDLSINNLVGNNLSTTNNVGNETASEDTDNDVRVNLSSNDINNNDINNNDINNNDTYADSSSNSDINSDTNSNSSIDSAIDTSKEIPVGNTLTLSDSSTLTNTPVLDNLDGPYATTKFNKTLEPNFDQSFEQSLPDLPEEGLESYLQEQERQLIIIALHKTNWNRTQAAKLLGTSFRSLRYRMKKLEIDTCEDGE